METVDEPGTALRTTFPFGQVGGARIKHQPTGLLARWLGSEPGQGTSNPRIPQTGHRRIRSSTGTDQTKQP